MLKAYSRYALELEQLQEIYEKDKVFVFKKLAFVSLLIAFYRRVTQNHLAMFLQWHGQCNGLESC